MLKKMLKSKIKFKMAMNWCPTALRLQLGIISIKLEQ